MKKILILILFSIACFFIHDNVEAAGSYWDFYKFDFSYSDMPGWKLTNDVYMAEFVPGGSQTFNNNTDLATPISGADTLQFNVILTGEDMKITGGTDIKINNIDVTAIVISTTGRHMTCSSYSGNNSTITMVCPLNYQTTYTSIAWKIYYNSADSSFDAFYLSIPAYATIYYGEHSSYSDVIENDNKNQQETNEKLDETNKELGELNDNITNSEVDSSSSSSFFGNYQDNDYGLTSIITAPLKLIQNLTSASCTPLTLPLPFVDKNLTLPCMSTIYSQHFGTLYTLYQTITYGFIAYWVAVRIYALVKGFKDPENDKVEVMDL